jgi:putative hydrolases of HD superfamily
MNETKLVGVSSYLYEMGLLKRMPRAGWLVAGVRNPESIAEHSFRAALIGYMLAVIEGADPYRTATLALFHDTQETRTGDVPYVGREYVTTASNQAVTADQVADLPDQAATGIRELVVEYEDAETVESRLARDADKLDCLLQAREYQGNGNADLQAWIDSSVRGLRTEAGKQLAATCLEVAPSAWWRAVTGRSG